MKLLLSQFPGSVGLRSVDVRFLFGRALGLLGVPELRQGVRSTMLGERLVVEFDCLSEVSEFFIRCANPSIGPKVMLARVNEPT